MPRVRAVVTIDGGAPIVACEADVPSGTPVIDVLRGVSGAIEVVANDLAEQRAQGKRQPESKTLVHIQPVSAPPGSRN